MLKPPPGHKVAVIVFEDLGCPGCANAHPNELKAAEHTGVPLVRYDFPLAAHVWTFQAAVCARYLPELAGKYRTDVFASQRTIANKEDLEHFTEAWMARHGKPMPFVPDPVGSLAKKVKADYDLGIRLNVEYAPMVVVVTRDKFQVACGVKDVMDPAELLPTVEGAIRQTHGK